MKEKLKSILSNKKIFIIFFLTLAIIASIQSLLAVSKAPLKDKDYGKSNNYMIYQRSFHHLVNNQDLYAAYTEEAWDIYKYTPTCAVFFGFFAMFPFWLGLILWNVFNALLLLFAIYYLPNLSKIGKGLILLIISIELMTSVQNGQSNGLIAGLLIFSFGLLENKKYLPAALCIVFSAFIKPFGLVGFAMFLFYPGKLKLILYSILGTVILFLLPLIFIGISQYYNLLLNYWNMMSHDHSKSSGNSVMGWLNSWFYIDLNKNLIVLLGIIIFLIPLYKVKVYKNYTFRFLMLSSILIWIVIFNHMAESPTFIIAMTGIALWFIKSEKNYFNIALFVLAFILTSLSPTDLFPKFLREEFFKPYSMKAFPCIIIWLKIIYDMIMVKKEKITE